MLESAYTGGFQTMGEHTEKALMQGLIFGWKFLDTKQQEAVSSILRIAKSLSDEKILELGKRGKK